MRRAGLHARACGSCGGSRANEQPRPCAVRAMEDVPARTESGGRTPPFGEPVRPTAGAPAGLGRRAGRTHHRTCRRATFRKWGRLASPGRSFGLGTLARRPARHRARRAARREGRSPRACLIGAVRIGGRLSRAVPCVGTAAEARGERIRGGARPGPRAGPAWNCGSPTRIATSPLSRARCNGSRSRANRRQSRAPAVARRGCRGSCSSLGDGRYLLEARRDLALRGYRCRQHRCRSRSHLVAERRLTLRAWPGLAPVL
jgi:hypothetical protein